MRLITYIFIIAAFFSFAIACSNNQPKEPDLGSFSWEQIEERAQGSTVNLMMWTGDPKINAYMNGYVVPQVKERYNIDLNVASGQGNTIVSILLAEIEAGKQNSELDMAWINGETFYQLRQIDALYGPFTDRLPNSKNVDFDNPFIGVDFQQPVDGYETPWGNVQFTLIYDTERVSTPPKNLVELESYVKANPGTFTIPSEFSGMTLLKSFLIEFAKDDTLYGPFDEEKYEKYSQQMWEYINRIKPYLWKQGETFPTTLSAVHQMYVNGELNFTMSNNDSEVDNKVLEGFFPNTSKAYVLESGTIQNSHYMGIVKHSNNKAGAMVVSNFLISEQAQYKKMNPEVWGDGTILDISKLSKEWQQRFAEIPNRNYAPSRSDIHTFALQELDPEYMIRLFDDFRTYVVEN